MVSASIVDKYADWDATTHLAICLSGKEHLLPRTFTDPLGSRLPALEQNVLKLRAMQMLLVLFYAEELKRDVLDLIQGTDELRTRTSGKASSERVPKGTKDPVRKALNALVVDGAITTTEMKEIVELIDYRNVIGHEMHGLFEDVNSNRVAREVVAYAPHLLPKYNHGAVTRLRHFHNRLNDLYRTHHYVHGANFNGLLFSSAERTFLGEIRRLRSKIQRLTNIRRADIASLNMELSLDRTELVDEQHPRHPLSTYDDGRLTKRGVEICYRLFDMGKSTLAVAHIAGLSLVAARRRQTMWRKLGGMNRQTLDIATIPRRNFHSRHDD